MLFFGAFLEFDILVLNVKKTPSKLWHHLPQWAPYLLRPQSSMRLSLIRPLPHVDPHFSLLFLSTVHFQIKSTVAAKALKKPTSFGFSRFKCCRFNVWLIKDVQILEFKVDWNSTEVFWSIPLMIVFLFHQTVFYSFNQLNTFLWYCFFRVFLFYYIILYHFKDLKTESVGKHTPTSVYRWYKTLALLCFSLV